jgi:hypothetical protein
MWIFAMIMAVGAVAASFARLRRVRGAVSFDLAELTRALGRNSEASRLAELRQEMSQEGECWETELIGVVLDARDSEQRDALVNEVLGDVGSELWWGGRIPAVAARLSALGPLCVVFFSLATYGVGFLDIVPVIAWAFAGVTGSLAVGREADRVAAETRKSIDTWVARVLDAASRTAALPLA